MLRTLVRDKANLVAESGDWLRRMQKSLDQMNVRVHRAVADINGATGMAILRAIAEGERDPRKLARLRDPRCQKTEEQIAEQLSGHWREDHLFSLQQALQMYDAIRERIPGEPSPCPIAAAELAPESVVTSLAGFASGAGSVVGLLAGFAGGSRPQPPGGRTAMPAAFR